jgi:hypothetical protein
MRAVVVAASEMATAPRWVRTRSWRPRRRRRLAPRAPKPTSRAAQRKPCYPRVSRAADAELEGTCPAGLAARAGAAPLALGRGRGNGVLGEVDRRTNS